MTSQPSSEGAPASSGGSSTRRPSGKALLSASWGLLRQDRELLWLPVIATISAAVAALILFVPGFAIGWAIGGSSNPGWAGAVGAVFAAFAASVVSVYFQAALVLGAVDRAEGRDPSLRGVLGQAWARRRRILAWAVVTTTVGVAIRALQERLGVLGALLGFLGGLAWAIASFLVVPVLVVEDVGPITAVKRSSALLAQTWGTGLRTTVRFGLIYLGLVLLPIGVIALGVVSLGSGTSAGAAGGLLLIVVGAIGLITIAMVFSAVGAYARTLLYRYATGSSVPGVDPRVLQAAFQAKGAHA